ncbi:exonuclease SbcC [Nocardioides daedukensis]|uniref:Nuclease SbcCD subunit C n=1 Tax=Nocardioides daedukensis TaxID=634462 RepID=A0A7Y9RZP6_9ACTN|nr:SMC family ATPase [Nocardioides daedukensis]NYG57603.1 exonuclease SbcC [Nocardioides daedukensis]
MRLHHLSITAFGPFAETVEVDFDQLSEAGLFLLSGATGSGKTSVLDAVCFAIFGDVPGDRAGAKRLRCDTAAPGVAPRVVLETTLSGRRFRITRSPAWSRPKKRGTGLTPEQAHVVLEERLGGEWSALSNRLDETGHVITGLVGMNMTQFCQVALLPQGEFQSFLRARSEDRHKLLQHLFSTQRFEDIEQWLREHARQLNREVNSHQRGVASVLDRVQEASGESLPETWASDDLAEVLDDGLVQSWVAGLVEDADNKFAQAGAHAETVESATESARAARDSGHRVADLQSRAARSRAQLDQVESERSLHEERKARLALSRRAAPMAPLHRHALAAGQQHEAAAAAALTARVTAAVALGQDEPTDTTLREAADEARRTIAVAGALLPREPELAALRASLAAGTRSAHELATRHENLTAQAAELPGRIEDLTRRLATASDQASRVETLEARYDALAHRIAQAERLTGVRTELAEASVEHDRVVHECLRLKEDWLSIREARIAGMAAELAHGLAIGGCCPVCGSDDHPNKAEPTPGAPSAQSEKEARRLVDDAELNRTATDGKVRELAIVVAQLEGEIGDTTIEDLQTEKDEVAADLVTVREAVALCRRLEPALALAVRTLEGVRQDTAAIEVELATLSERAASDQARADQITAEIDAVRGDHPDLTTLIAATKELAGLCEEALKRADDAAATARAAEDAARALDDWLQESGFDSVDEAAEGLLGPDQTESLTAAILAHESAEQQARAGLDDPEVVAAEKLAPPEVRALDAEFARLELALKTAVTELHVARTADQRLTALSADLSSAIAKWEPARAAHKVAADLAALVHGTAADNELRMRLSAYVLAWRLSQVVAAANERLGQMSDERYTLEHTARRGAGETRGGLSLLVRDEWSGESRDPATLSGGETFVVSLALALGLADVVTREAGGADLDTLFVDEGFGSLDSDTLDDVMDTLDTLRDGGRVVGVVSHVAEMRSRIPTRLSVTKHRTGSTLAISRDAG